MARLPRIMRTGRVVASGLVIWLVGCGGSIETYRPPALSEAQAAIVSGGDGVYVVEVDGKSIGDARALESGVGGNEVLLTSGNHRICVGRALSDPFTSLKYSLSSRATFEHSFVAGHRYQVDYTAVDYRMKDETTGEEIDPVR